jgi:hypothetical protein
MKVRISKDGIEGLISYNRKKIKVDFPDQETKEKILAYFNTEREYKIPEPNRIDNYRVDFEMPTKSKMYFELTLNTLHTGTGVWVHW